MNTKFNHLGVLVRVFFGQDYDLFGEDFYEILAAYKNAENTKAIQETIREAHQLLESYPDENELNLVFSNLAEGEFSPTAWGFTARLFLENVIIALSN
jgi:hypothetical protein